MHASSRHLDTRDSPSRAIEPRGQRVGSAKTKRPPVELVACIDGRGFGERAKDMQRILTATKGKTFTLTTLDQLITYTRIAEFVGHAPEPTD